MENQSRKFKTKYKTKEEILTVLSEATEIREIANLYYINAEMIEGNADLKAQFLKTKNKFFNLSMPVDPVDNPLDDASDEDTDDEEQEELDEREEERQDDNM